MLYGIKVSFWGSATLKIVIPVETYGPETSFSVGLLSHPSGVGGVNKRIQYIYLPYYGVHNKQRNDFDLNPSPSER